MLTQIISAGFGGQGVLLLGQLIAYAGLKEGYDVSWLPSYGPEMRGGTANCSVVVSDEEVGSPVVTQADIDRRRCTLAFAVGNHYRLVTFKHSNAAVCSS